MGYYCTVPQCTSLAGKTKNVKFHRFPRDKVMAEKWNVILKRGKPFTKYSKVCSLHFTHADYNVTTMGQWKTLSKDAIPSQNLPKLNPDGTVMVIRKSRTVKFREVKKEPLEQSDKIIADKWSMPVPNHIVPIPECNMVNCPEQTNLPPYRLQSLNAIANAVSPVHQLRPKKQDAIMQTDPVASEDDDSQPNNSYSEVSEQSHTSELEAYQDFKKYAKEDYIPQTNEEYNKEAEKYALERKSHVLENGYQKLPLEGDYHKVDMYSYEKSYQRGDYYQNGFQDSVELLRNQQHNIQILQDQHRPAENQNFFNENHIKQEIDVNTDEEKFLYERSKEQLDASAVYSDSQRRLQQQRLFDHIQQQVKREPETPNGCESVMQPQGSPYYPTNGHSNMSGAYFEQLSRPGPELLIAKQNALAAHTQLWQNTMKRPFFYSENPHYNGPQLLHRYEVGASANQSVHQTGLALKDLTRILQ